MSDLARYRASNSPAVPDGFSRREGKALQLATNREVGAGIVANIRLDVARYVTYTAMNHTAELAKYGYALADGDEYLGSRLGQLVDNYVCFARGEVRGLQAPW